MKICKTEMIRKVVKENLQASNKKVKELVWAKYGVRVVCNAVMTSGLVGHASISIKAAFAVFRTMSFSSATVAHCNRGTAK